MGRSWLEKCHELGRHMKADKELGRDDLIYTLMAQKEDVFFQVEKKYEKAAPLRGLFPSASPDFPNLTLLKKTPSRRGFSRRKKDLTR